MMINGYYGDGDVVMLSSIMVSKGYSCPPYLRTYSWNDHLGHTLQLQAIWL